MAQLKKDIQIEIKQEDIVAVLSLRDQEILRLTALCRQLVEEIAVWRKRTEIAEANQAQPAQ